MSDSKISLTLDDINIYAGACLTYSGVPFHRVEKLRIGKEELDHLDRLFDQLVRAKGELRRAADAGVPASNLTKEIVFNEADVELLIEVLATTLKEHEPPGYHADYALELHVGPRSDVEESLHKLRSFQHEAQPA